MQSIHVSGSLPASIDENTAFKGWAAGLQMPGDPRSILFVDVVGTADIYFDASYDRNTGAVSVFNIASPDYEGFVAAGRSTTLSLQLRVMFSDGSWGLSDTTWSVAVNNVDDTPPQSLTFASGGGATPGVAGAVIGTLAVVDPDTAEGFTYTIAEADAWMYDIVGNTLKLKPGVALSMSDGPYRAIFVDVSDGHQSSAFRLDIKVESPAGETAVLDVLDTWENRFGFSWKSSDTVWAGRGLFELQRMEFYGTELVELVMKDGNNLWLANAQKIEFLNGTIDLRPDSTAFHVDSYYHAILARHPGGDELGMVVRMIDQGSWDYSTLSYLLVSSQEFGVRYGNVSNENFARLLYQNAAGDVNAGGVQYWKAQLDAGVPRWQVAKSFSDWDVNQENTREAAPYGEYMTRPWAREVIALYEAGLDRLPDRPTFEYWISVLSSGSMSLGQVTELFADCLEAQIRYAGYSSEAFVRDMFTRVLGREADPGGLSYWTYMLDHHFLQKKDVIAAFGLSQENYNQINDHPPGSPF